jgi:membrane-associated PAP2 superfamily phosphatase
MRLVERLLQRVGQLPLVSGPLLALLALWIWSLRLRTGRVCQEIGVYVAHALSSGARSPSEDLLLAREICFGSETQLAILAYSLAGIGVLIALSVGLRRRPGQRLTRAAAYTFCGGVLALLIVYRFIVII